MLSKPTDSNRPLRTFEKMLKGGLGAGHVGAIVAPHGTGKNAILTSIAIDHAMAGNQVLHIAVGKSVSDVRAYHDEILTVIEDSISATNRADLLTKVERHSQIYTFRDGQFDIARLEHTLQFLAQHAEFRPRTIMFQGWPSLPGCNADQIAQLRAIAQQHQCEIWLALHTPQDAKVDGHGLPAGFSALQEQLEVVVTLGTGTAKLPLRFVKVHQNAAPLETHLEFDPATMLIRWH